MMIGTNMFLLQIQSDPVKFQALVMVWTCKDIKFFFLNKNQILNKLTKLLNKVFDELAKNKLLSICTKLSVEVIDRSQGFYVFFNFNKFSFN